MLAAVRGVYHITQGRLDLVEEAGGRLLGGTAEECTLAGVRHVQHALSAGDPDVEQAALLLQVRAVVSRANIREDAVLAGRQEDDRELQTLGRANR